MESSEKKLRELGYHFSYLSSANDGVSCDSRFCRDGLLSFLTGKVSHTAHTDTNHNAKNGRYQILIGGNSVKTIGIYMIDTGMIKKCGIPNEEWRVKDFASDRLVLNLCSARTALAMLNLPGQEQESQVVLALTLFFKRVHLFSINAKGNIVTARERVVMLWSSLLWVLHVDGTHIITKRNWIVECVSLAFLLMRSDVIQIHRTTTEPSEHSNAIMRGIVREFSVLDFLSIINKLDSLWAAMVDGELKMVRDAKQASGYLSTIETHAKKVEVPSLQGGPVKINAVLSIFEQAAEGSVTSQIWKELKPILNQTNAGMKDFLTSVVKVKELHPLINKFKSEDHHPVELIERIKLCFEPGKTDDLIYKNEKRPMHPTEKVNRISSVWNEGTMLNPNIDIDGFQNDPLLRQKREEEMIIVAKRMVKDVVDANAKMSQNEKGKKKNIDTMSKDADTTSNTAVTNSAEVQDGDSGMKQRETITRGSVFAAFTKVIMNTSMISTVSNAEDIVSAMLKMDLGKREKGSKNGECKFKSLLQRWYGGKIKKEDSNKKESEELTRGSIVQIFESTSKMFVVTTVWRVDGSGKWFPSLLKDNPSWPLVEAEMKRYRLGLREVRVEKNEVHYLHGDEIKDGVNVRDSIRLVSLAEVRSSCYKVTL